MRTPRAIENPSGIVPDRSSHAREEPGGRAELTRAPALPALPWGAAPPLPPPTRELSGTSSRVAGAGGMLALSRDALAQPRGRAATEGGWHRGWVKPPRGPADAATGTTLHGGAHNDTEARLVECRSSVRLGWSQTSTMGWKMGFRPFFFFVNHPLPQVFKLCYI